MDVNLKTPFGQLHLEGVSPIVGVPVFAACVALWVAAPIGAVFAVMWAVNDIIDAGHATFWPTAVLLLVLAGLAAAANQSSQPNDL